MRQFKFSTMQRPNLTAFLLVMFFSATIVRGQGTWTNVQDLPAPRIYMTAAEFNGKIYVFGGSAVPPYSSESTVFVYDTATMTWALQGFMPKTICGMSAVRMEDKIYIVGGGPTVFGAPSGEVYTFDPVANSWEQMADMITPRSFCATSALDGKIYTVGGLIGESPANVIPSNAVEVYDPVTNMWTSKNPFPYAVIDAIAAALEDNIYVIGGSTGYPYVGLTNNMRYNPLNDSWVAQTFMPTGRWGAPGVVLDDKIYVVGGNTILSTNFAAVEVFDPVTGAWTIETPMPAPRRSLAAAALGGKIYAIGGLGDDVLDKVEVFTPGSSATGDLEITESNILQLYPTVANPRTTVRYEVVESGEIEIVLFDASAALRRRLAGHWHTPGTYTVEVDAAALESGVYFCAMREGDKLLAVRKMVVQR